MKALQRISFSLIGVALLVVPVMAARAVEVATQYSTRSNIDSIEAANSKPIPTTVTWIASEQAENGDKTLDHFEVVVIDDTEAELASIDVTDITDRTITLTKDNVEGMKVFSSYGVRVDEYYTDGDSSEGFDDTFYTRPPKLKNIRVKNKTLEDDGDMTVTVKWRQPVNLRDEYVYYDYKVVYPKNNSRLVADDYEWGNDVNSATISNLPARKLKVKIRARHSQYGTGQWSKWKTFNAPISE